MLLLFWRTIATTAVVVVRGQARVAVLASKQVSTTLLLESTARSLVVVGSTRTTTGAVRGTARTLASGRKEALAPAAFRVRGRALETVLKAGSTLALLRATGQKRTLIESLHFQTVGPIADISDGSWINELGNQIDLYASIDEASPNAADYIESSLSPLVVDEVRLLLAPLDDPGTSDHHHLRVRYQKDTPDSDQIDLTVRLYAADGVTLVREETYVDIEAVTDADITLSPAEAAGLTATDYAGLILVFRAIKI